MSRIAFLALLAAPRLALAFNLEHDASNSPIQWPGGEVSFLLDPTSRDVDSADVVAAAQRAASHWEAVANVAIHIATESNHGAPGYDPTQPSQNHNEIFFLDNTWDYDELVLAETLVTSDATTHEILDTDVLINGAQHHFAILPDSSESGQGLTDDLESTLTHELGHALGLAHNFVLTTATMYPSATVGEVSERLLAADDIAGVQSLYNTGHDAAQAAMAAGCSSGAGTGSAPLLALMLLAVARRARRASVVVGVVAVSSAASLASAETPELAVKGIVRTTHAEWRGGLIVTHISLDVLECRKGSCPASLELEMVGGRLDGLEQTMSSQPIPHEGDALEVSLAHNRHGMLRPVGPVGPVITQRP